MSVRLLALDIDGTLLDSRKRIAPRTRHALCRARDAGVLLVLVTGRRLPPARRIADGLWPGIHLVLHNGALVYESGEVVHCRPLPTAAAREAVAVGRREGLDPVLHRGPGGEGRLVVGPLDSRNGGLRGYLDRARGEVCHVSDLATPLTEPPLEVMFGGGLDALDVLYARLCDALHGRALVERTVYRRYDLGILDVVHPRAGKAEAVALLQSRHGIDAAQTLAIGDNWNDHGMLQAAGRGLVMGNAEPELRALGFEVLPSNDEEGVAVAVERYVLGPG